QPSTPGEWLFVESSRSLLGRMDGHKNQPLGRRLGFAMAGIVVTWKTEASLRFQVVVFVFVVVALTAVRVEPVWWALVMLACALVFTAELFNTALENLAD